MQAWRICTVRHAPNSSMKASVSPERGIIVFVWQTSGR